jgi:hypothetical protein
MAELRPTTPRREKILVSGPQKVGKSSLWLDIIRIAYEKGYKGKFYLVDNDNTWEDYVSEYGAFEDEGLLKVYQPWDLEDALKARTEIVKKIKTYGSGSNKIRDWIILDMLDWFWTEAEVMYINRVHGDEPEDYFLSMRREVKDAGGKHGASFGGQEGTDWGFITKVYKQFEVPLVMKSQAHVISISSEKKLDENRGASPEEIAQHKHVSGMKAAGQKGIGHRHSTIMRMIMRRDGRRQLTMIGDRVRQEKVWPEKVGSRTVDVEDWPKGGFVRAYLKKVAGWTTLKEKK